MNRGNHEDYAICCAYGFQVLHFACFDVASIFAFLITVILLILFLSLSFYLSVCLSLSLSLSIFLSFSLFLCVSLSLSVSLSVSLTLSHSLYLSLSLSFSLSLSVSLSLSLSLSVSLSLSLSLSLPLSLPLSLTLCFSSSQTECLEKYDDITFGMFVEVFSVLPLFAVRKERRFFWYCHMKGCQRVDIYDILYCLILFTMWTIF